MFSSACKANADTDIAFLLDGSGSVSSQDFRTMKTFVKNLIRKLLKQNTLVSLSTLSTTKYYSILQILFILLFRSSYSRFLDSTTLLYVCVAAWKITVVFTFAFSVYKKLLLRDFCRHLEMPWSHKWSLGGLITIFHHFAHSLHTYKNLNSLGT